MISLKLYALLLSRVIPKANFSDATGSLAIASVNNYLWEYSAHTWFRNLCFSSRKGMVYMHLPCRYVSTSYSFPGNCGNREGIKILRESYKLGKHFSADGRKISFFSEFRIAFNIWVLLSQQYVIFGIYADSQSPIETRLYNEEIWKAVEGGVGPSAQYPAVSLAQAAIYIMIKFWAEENLQTLRVLKQVRITKQVHYQF